MSDTVAILSARGAFYRVQAYDDYGPALYAIDELVHAYNIKEQELKDSLERQTLLQQSALDNAKVDSAALQRVKNRLSNPAEIAISPQARKYHENDMDYLQQTGALGAGARDALKSDVLLLPAGSDGEATQRFEGARDVDLPLAVQASKDRENVAASKIQDLSTTLQKLSVPKSLDRTQILIMGVQVSKRDIVSQVPCLNNAKVLYSFGQNFGDVAIRGDVLLGAVGQQETSEQGVKTLTDFFESHRISRSLMPIAVSVASHAFYVYLTGMVIQEIDPEFNVMPFMMTGILLDLSREDMAKVNPAGMVLSEKTLDDPALIKALGQRKSVRTIDQPAAETAASNAATSNNSPPTLGSNSPFAFATELPNNPYAVAQRQALLNQTLLAKPGSIDGVQYLKDSDKLAADRKSLEQQAQILGNTTSGSVQNKVSALNDKQAALDETYLNRLKNERLIRESVGKPAEVQNLIYRPDALPGRN